MARTRNLPYYSGWCNRRTGAGWFDTGIPQGWNSRRERAPTCVASVQSEPPAGRNACPTPQNFTVSLPILYRFTNGSGKASPRLGAKMHWLFKERLNGPGPAGIKDHAACDSQCQFQPGTPMHSQFTLSPPEKVQSSLWKQPHRQSGSRPRLDSEAPATIAASLGQIRKLKPVAAPPLFSNRTRTRFQPWLNWNVSRCSSM